MKPYPGLTTEKPGPSSDSQTELSVRRRKSGVLRLQTNAQVEKPFKPRPHTKVFPNVLRSSRFIVLFCVLTLIYLLYARRLSLQLISGYGSKESSTRFDFLQYSEDVRRILGNVHFPIQIVGYFKSEKLFHGPLPRITESVLLNYDPLLTEVSRFFDVRLAPVLSLALFRQDVESKKKFNIRYRAPFSWNSWLDLDSMGSTHDLMGKPVDLASCEAFVDHFELDFEIPCQSRAEGLAITGPTTKPLPVSARRIFAASYLANSAPAPKRLLFLDADLRNLSLSIPTLDCHSREKCLYDMAIDYIDRDSDYCRDEGRCEQLLRKGINFKSEVLSLSNAIQNYQTRASLQNHTDKTRIIPSQASSLKNSLSREDFILDLPKLQSQALDSLKRISSQGNEPDFDRAFLSSVATMDTIHPPKYFFEATLSSKHHNGAHYDWRFFNRALYDDHERSLLLHRITKAWLTFAQNSGINTWLMHGTLLGYYFNGMNMPFDGDLDVVMTMDSLVKLAREYNQTLVVDTSLDHNSNEELGIGAYLIDVNPTYLLRERGNGQNTIDARFVDIHTGLYIDITAISSTIGPQFNIKSLSSFQVEFKRMLDPEYTNNIAASTVDAAKYAHDLDKTLEQHIQKKTIYNCKNNHFYLLDDISPLRDAHFEGLPAKVPHKLVAILQREYKNALRKFQFKNYIYRPGLRLWVLTKDCPKSKTDEQCLSSDKVAAEFNRTLNYTRLHKELKSGNFRGVSQGAIVMKPDPWLLSIAEALESV